ncbi:tryptophan-rich sensory protein [Knoellia subterranea]|uniref:DNA-binding protein n=1 Tax=Knoellia subterranea KCTC 19937 TaxID=1385521 RepID=A0A0A0JNC3_9MICO|nr:tryptophan-rich sensory protein [Knoellia subterranea]KGN37121.1 DNA-binding protein [Knoellia subterranea KCTC 19937]
MTHPNGRVLVTGASGHVGSRLVPRLLAEGWAVRVLTRRSDGVADQPWVNEVDVVVGDVADRHTLRRALADVGVAYYLVHSMSEEPDYAARDRQAALAFGEVARDLGVSRIVYLGGLHPDHQPLSGHLASRAEVGRILLRSGVPTAALQAAMVIGAGSASFEMLRHLTSRLPVMVAPTWLDNRIQPIAVDDVVTLLAGAAHLPPSVNRTFDVGGPDVLTYREMIGRFADIAGLVPRVVVGTRYLAPQTASRWVRLVTPVPAGLARSLVDSLVHDIVAQEDDLIRLVPIPSGALTFDEAVGRALADTGPDRALRNLGLTAAAVTVTALAGMAATQPDSRWYRSLDLPPWQPPKLAFPVVWTALYADIAVATAAALTRLDADGETDDARRLRRSLATNLVLNAGWSVVFWRIRRPGLAAVESAVLAVSSAELARRVSRSHPGAGRALLPYAVWTGFATVLSAAIHRRNRPRA